MNQEYRSQEPNNKYWIEFCRWWIVIELIEDKSSSIYEEFCPVIDQLKKQSYAVIDDDKYFSFFFQKFKNKVHKESRNHDDAYVCHSPQY